MAILRQSLYFRQFFKWHWIMKRGYDQPDDDNDVKDVTNLPTGWEQSTSTATINTVHVSSIQKKDLVKLNYSLIHLNSCKILFILLLLLVCLHFLLTCWSFCFFLITWTISVYPCQAATWRAVLPSASFNSVLAPDYIVYQDNCLSWNVLAYSIKLPWVTMI